MDAAKEFRAKGMQARIFALVHDSIVVVHPDEETEQVQEILKRCTQKDRGCSIKGKPIGVDQDTHRDYSIGKFEKVYGVLDGALFKHEPK
jgi:DNA polymerase I-like protein with 3'-5' exonuclease and polymerase domains